jgi:hypothetical protein
MEPIKELIRGIDPILIEPYRWLPESVWAWWLGTVLLCLWAVIVGEITYRIVKRINKKYVHEHNDEMVAWNNRAMNALKAGNKEVYTGANKLANDAFGRSFFLSLAMGMASLWPAFLGAAWLQARFQGVPVPVPFMDAEINWVPPYVVMYIVTRIGMSRVFKLMHNVEIYSAREQPTGLAPPGVKTAPDGADQK